ncbi:MAG TPA: hypothetical protein DCS91_18685 [Microcoleaceae bacterium UBA11344]|nr:hypothetical protein [Microcoleaceae cyanobacterium UBA11344]
MGNEGSSATDFVTDVTDVTDVMEDRSWKKQEEIKIIQPFSMPNSSASLRPIPKSKIEFPNPQSPI